MSRTYHYRPRATGVLCATCGRPANGYRARYCSRDCAPVGGGVPYATVREAVLTGQTMIGCTPELVAADLGMTVAALHRRLYRHGDDELARWVGPTFRAQRAAAQQAA